MDLTGKDICPRCGAPMKIGVGHSCQDNPKDEHYGQIGDRGCLEDALDARKWDKEMEKFMNPISLGKKK